MAKANVGDRVGAIRDADKETVNLYGFGVYEGERVPAEAVGMMAELAKELGHTNPCIRLDSGDLVYGCECWWGSEAEIKKAIGGRRVNVVSVADDRAGMAEAEQGEP